MLARLRIYWLFLAVLALALSSLFGFGGEPVAGGDGGVVNLPSQNNTNTMAQAQTDSVQQSSVLLESGQQVVTKSRDGSAVTETMMYVGTEIYQDLQINLPRELQGSVAFYTLGGPGGAEYVDGSIYLGGFELEMMREAGIQQFGIILLHPEAESVMVKVTLIDGGIYSGFGTSGPLVLVSLLNAKAFTFWDWMLYWLAKY